MHYVNIFLQYKMADIDKEVLHADNQTEVKVPNDLIWKFPLWIRRMSWLINNELMSDVTFIVKEKRFAAHKFVLALASEAFHAMFYGLLANEKKEIEIVDCEKPEDFLEFLSLIYSKSAKITWDNVQQLSYLRKKYMILESGPFVEFITSIVGTESILNALNISVSLEEDGMIDECLKVIRKDICVLVKTKDFLELSQSSLKVILKQDMLNIKEIYLFNAVDKWCSYQVELKRANGEEMTKREVLGDALYHIRFPTIGLKDFTMWCKPSKILKNEEIVDLYDPIVLNPLELAVSKRRKLNEEGAIGVNLSDSFISIPRLKGNIIVNLFDDKMLNFSDVLHDRYLYDSELVITVNTKVWLKGVRLLDTSISTIKIGGDNCELDHERLLNDVAWLKVPFLMTAGKMYSIKHGGRYHVNFDLRCPIFKWNDFECTIKQVNLACSELIFSIFDGEYSDTDAMPSLDMMAKRCLKRKLDDH